MDNTRNKFGVIVLGIILLFFIVGGYFFMDYMLKTPDKDKKNNKQEPEVVDLRINKSKDYIYYDNETEIIDDIFKRDVIINIGGYEIINDTLHSELESINSNQVRVTTEEIPEGTTCENDLYSFSYRDYEIMEYGDYKSLVIKDYDYNGKNLTNEELLTKFNLNEDNILEQVKKRLEDTQILDEDVQVIDVDGTLNDIKNSTYGTNKALSISKNGKLMLNFIVKSNKINYNDSIELN